MNVNLADIMPHIDESLDSGRREAIENTLRQEQGGVSAATHDSAPHLMLVA
jgi:hypothetical protein